MYSFDQEIEHGELLGAATWSVSECLRRKEAMRGNYDRALEKCRAVRQSCEKRLEDTVLSERIRVLQKSVDETRRESREIEDEIKKAAQDAEEFRNSFEIRKELQRENESRAVYNGIVEELRGVLAFSQQKNEELAERLIERQDFLGKLTAGLGEVEELIGQGARKSELDIEVYRARVAEIEFGSNKQLELIRDMEQKLIKTDQKLEKCVADKIEFEKMVEGIEKYLKKSKVLD